ncbi:MAG: hypothetical protein GC154_17200 [bacterium]|nr:hypothetical protein [bacterium]
MYDKLQYADEADLQDYLLKDGSSRPQQVLIPAADPDEELDHYISITGTVTGYDGPYQYVHAFCSAEDKFDAIYSDPPQLYHEKYPNRCDAYSRIVYARSSNSISFTRMHDSSGSLVDGATPVLTHWQSEAIAFHPAATTFVLTGGPISGPTYEPLSLVGVGGPSVIELGDYYYMFYTRWWDTREQSRDPSVTVAYPDYGWNSFISSVTLAGTTPSSSDPEWADWIRYWARENVCVARAPKYNVNYSGYASNSNPWTKHHEYYTGSGRADEWTSAIKGLDTAVLPDPGVYGKVSWNTYLERYVMITMDAQNYGYFYIQEATNPAKTDWHDMILNDWSPRIAIDMADVEKGYEKRISYPTIIGDTDKTTARYNAMYYAMEVNDTNGTIHDGFVTGTHYMRRVTSFEFVK